MASRDPTSSRARVPFACVLATTIAAGAVAVGGPVAGAKVGLRDYHGPATVAQRSAGPYGVRLIVDPNGERNPIVIHVDLPATGPGWWPAEKVEVVDSNGQPVPVTRDGVEWHRLQLSVPPVHAAYSVRLAEPSSHKSAPRLPAEKERDATDPDTGLRATICPWFSGRRAALSFRFDDSHPTHLSTAIPILREFGFRGTFMVNPGLPDFQEHKAEWEAVARQGDQEFGNHTWRHHGAAYDQDADREIGLVSEYLWTLFPEKSHLLALNLGGGTKWTTTRPLGYYLDKHSLFYVSGSLGMDDVYGNRVSAFRRHLTGHLERGQWCRTHFHSIGKALAASEANFRAAMKIAQAHEQELWIAGMADIYKYQQERASAKLSLTRVAPDRLSLRLVCGTGPRLYDQPLTLELALPATWSPHDIAVTDHDGSAIQIRAVHAAEAAVARFEVAPVAAEYVVEHRP